MHGQSDKTITTASTLSFFPVKIANITKEGSDSDDNGRTYVQLSAVANDKNTLISSFGCLFGNIMSRIPTSWKAWFYRKQIEGSERVLGTISLSEIDKRKYKVENELGNLNVYNVGVQLLAEYQRRGIVSGIAKTLFRRFAALNTDMDGFWISTRPSNQGVIHLAEKYQFTYIKRTWLFLLPCIPFPLSSLLYWKPIQ